MKYDDVMRGLDLAGMLLRKQGLMAGDADVKMTSSIMEERVEVRKQLDGGTLMIAYTPKEPDNDGRG